MANLLGQNIGTNYKGILNLNTLNGNLSGTLQAVTDGDGNASPLQLSTSQGQLSSVVFASGVLSRNTRDATGLRLFGGILITTNDSGYIQLQRDDTNFGAPIFGLANANFDSNFFRWERNGTEIARLTAPGNLYLGSGGITPSARLHVRGDGTNPIARFEESTGVRALSITSGGEQFDFGSLAGLRLQLLNAGGTLSTIATSFGLGSNVTTTAGYGFRLYATNNHSYTSGTGGLLILTGSFSAAAGSANYRNAQFDYTINNSGAQTGTATGIFLNATETALNGMTHDLINLQVGGVSRIKGTNSGELTTQSQYVVNNLRVGGTLYFGNFKSNITFNGDNNLLLKNAAENSFGLLQFGGTTSAFPALKRNGSEIEFKLADDSGNCNITAAQIKTGAGIFSSNTIYVNSGGGFHVGYGGAGGNLNLYPNSGTTQGAILTTGGFIVGGTSLNASARLQVDSTTQGFLPPRMTTAQRDLIATPAAGLVIYNTTTNVLNFYDGTVWGAV